jgi:membrane protein YdbS with pleckstrin-like domain
MQPNDIYSSHKGLPSLSDAATGSSTCRRIGDFIQANPGKVLGSILYLLIALVLAGDTKWMLLVLGFCMLVAASIGLLIAHYLYRRKQRISSSAAGN